MSADNVTLFWFRRDLRLDDNTALYHALAENDHVLPLFIFDRNILDKLPSKSDARVCFIHQHIHNLKERLEEMGSSILIKQGDPLTIFKALIQQYPVKAIYTNFDYEPYASKRDQEVSELMKAHNISFSTFKDHVIFEKNEIVKKDKTPFSVFTSYAKIWRKNIQESTPSILNTQPLFHRLLRCKPFPIIALKTLGFKPCSISFPAKEIHSEKVLEYDKYRNIPSLEGTTRLGVHLRFGTISIRRLAIKALTLNSIFLNELIWRDFFMMILWHHPGVVSKAFKPIYDEIAWRNNEAEFERWCNGKTGYPIVDAGMRQLNTTGFMHNRVRMIVASFLTKHLLIDWRWGEQYFADKLLDYELASNNGGWQWAAGSGCDAAPYFRIFNPTLQTKQYDPELKYIRQWVPELDSLDYPKPMVEHKTARERALKVYKNSLEDAKQKAAGIVKNK